ncbi:MAG: hypothetical protein OH354_05080 [Candidatus Parvarchaeota archaeon]|nr:hypothetical protein [Candidatus Jingweiarchaeum tengchongense]
MKEFPELKFKTTEELEVPKRLVDQVIGQDNAIEIIKKAATQRRNVLKSFGWLFSNYSLIKAKRY